MQNFNDLQNAINNGSAVLDFNHFEDDLYVLNLMTGQVATSGGSFYFDPTAYQPNSVLNVEGAVIGGLGDDLVTMGTADYDPVTGGYKGGYTWLNMGNDKFVGDAGGDEAHGQGGNDHLIGRDGEDKLYGGDGSDILDGGSGNDLLVTGLGSLDQAHAGDGEDTVEIANGATAHVDLGDDNDQDVLVLDMDLLVEDGQIPYTSVNNFEAGVDSIDLREMDFTQLDHYGSKLFAADTTLKIYAGNGANPVDVGELTVGLNPTGERDGSPDIWISGPSGGSEGDSNEWWEDLFGDLTDVTLDGFLNALEGDDSNDDDGGPIFTTEPGDGDLWGPNGSAGGDNGSGPSGFFGSTDNLETPDTSGGIFG